MFTGIVTAIGRIAATETRGDTAVRIACPEEAQWQPDTIPIGASIAFPICLLKDAMCADKSVGAPRAWCFLSAAATCLKKAREMAAGPLE